MSSVLSKLRKQPAWIALIIFVALGLWVTSGISQNQDDRVPPRQAEQETPMVKVSVERVMADKVAREITLYGRTEPDRVATLRAQVKGLVTNIYVQEGQQVKQGQKILSLDNSDYINRLRSAKALLKQRQVELSGAESLGQKGYQSQVALSQAQAFLAAAEAEVTAMQLAITRAEIVAPFDGIVNKRYVEEGDLLKDGDSIAMLVDLDPLVITANVTESNIGYLQKGQTATGKMVSGDTLKGNIRFISSLSEQGTNTFAVEVAVANPDLQYMAGMSTELSMPLEQTYAVRITPSVMALDEQGNLGVKIVEQIKNEYVVKFVPIDIVKSDSQGVWLAGLGEQADIITLGHGFVRDGDKVAIVRSDSSSTRGEMRSGAHVADSN